MTEPTGFCGDYMPSTLKELAQFQLHPVLPVIILALIADI
jgi:hypothetical protein